MIKPVQRVLKYPLLLRELRKETPETDPDYDNLTQALARMESVAAKINEVKKRQDIVEKNISKRDINLVHGFNKKFTRGAQQIKNVTLGVEEGEDQEAELLYMSMRTRFDMQLRSLATLQSGVQTWSTSFKEMINVKLRIIAEFEGALTEDGDINLDENIPNHKRELLSFKETRIPEMQSKVEMIIAMLETLEKLYRNPVRIMKKRDAKQLDHSRFCQLKARGEVDIDKQLIESSESFIALNQHLAEELPKLIRLSQEYIECCVVDFAGVQARSIRDLEQILGRSVGEAGIGLDADEMFSGLSILTLSPKKGTRILGLTC